MAPLNHDEEVVLSEEQLHELDKVKIEQVRTEMALDLRAQPRWKNLYEKRRSILKKIPKFWTTALSNHKLIHVLAQHRDDLVALSHLTDIWVDRNPAEPRAYSVQFHFSENPYFTDAVLKKEFVYDRAPRPDEDPTEAIAGEDGVSHAMLTFDPDLDLKPSAIKIKWKSDAKSLTKAHPRKTEPDDEDDVLEEGSFFNFFELSKDPSGIGSIIADDVFPHAIDYFLGQGDNNREPSDDEDGISEDEVADDAQDMDQPPPKKKAKN